MKNTFKTISTKKLGFTLLAFLFIIFCCSPFFAPQGRTVFAAENNVLLLSESVAEGDADEEWKQLPVENVEYNEVEAVVFGEVVKITASVTRGGVTKPQKINYSSLEVKELNKLFNTLPAVGSIDGWSGEIIQNIMVVPPDVKYFINLGANQTTTMHYLDGGTTSPALELDHSGVNAVTDPYFSAAQRLFGDELLNQTAAKQYNQNNALGNFGYEGSQQVAKTETAGKNIFQNMMFPKRGTAGVKVIAEGLNESSYDVYIGTLNYWSNRSLTLRVTGKPDTEATLMGQTLYPVLNVTPSGGAITAEITNPQNVIYFEGMMSFVIICESYENVSEELGAPQADTVMELDASELEVSGLVNGAKLIVYNLDSGSLLYEEICAADTVTVPFSTAMLENLYRIGLLQVRFDSTLLGRISPLIEIQRTDIQNFLIDYSTDFTGSDLSLNLSCYAISFINKVVVAGPDGESIYNVSTQSESFSYTVKVSSNGQYTVRVESGLGISTKEISVENIDKGIPSLSADLSEASVKASSSGSLKLAVKKESISPLKEMGYLQNGTSQALDVSLNQITFTGNGIYNVYFINRINKQAAKTVSVALNESDAVTVRFSRGEKAKTDKPVSIEMNGANGYTFASASAFFKGADGQASKVLVNGNKFLAYESGEYYIQIQTLDGMTEFTVINVANIISTKEFNALDKGLGAGAAAAIAAGVSVTVLGAGVFLAAKLVFFKKKKVSPVTQDITPPSENN